MFERSARARAAKAIRGGVARTIEFLEGGAPRGVESLGHRLHDKAAALHLMGPRRRAGLGVALGLLGVAIAGLVAANVGKLGLDRMVR